MEEWRGMTSQQIGTMIHDWIEEDGFPIESAGVPNTDFSWAVNTVGHKVYVLKFKNRKDSIVISSGIVFAENKESILTNSKIKDIFYDITSKYLELGLSYSFQPNFENTDLIELSQHIHYDGLNKHELAKIVSIVRNMAIWTEQKLSKETHGSVDVSSFKSVNSPISGGLPFE